MCSVPITAQRRYLAAAVSPCNWDPLQVASTGCLCDNVQGRSWCRVVKQSILSGVDLGADDIPCSSTIPARLSLIHTYYAIYESILVRETRRGYVCIGVFGVLKWYCGTKNQQTTKNKQ